MSDISPMRQQPKRSPTKRTEDTTRDLLHGISEKEVEIEHLKTVIVALDEKVKVVDSVREDLFIARDHLQESEAARITL